MSRLGEIVSTLIFLILSLFISVVYGQESTDSELYQTLKEKDSTLFNAAFNTCEPAVLESFFTEDFEFYHDKGGLTEGRGNFMSPVEEGCAQRQAGAPQPAKRILIPNSLEVFPLYRQGALYGAIQHGIHRFEFLDENQEYQQGDIAKFTHVWILENGDWKIRRELSYDHQSQNSK
ncbi:nuclear transport factor 2 family protein [Poritiphilus flavus]|uniref:DUF4440 domain-containing protein n=1 Tax=Poritiphilus flavus TaxID=2697053 RepID=A0A6L9EAE8_9FLAO|nr:nuclear transport factor 2 family protein [Poritiphilus flavus]NAS11562.1 DUF4440 domain-containing protein [Poritiphilus flavus]